MKAEDTKEVRRMLFRASVQTFIRTVVVVVVVVSSFSNVAEVRGVIGKFVVCC